MSNVVYVTGGAGFIGSQVVRDLLEKNYIVKVIDDLSTGATSNLPNHKNLTFFKGSILDVDLLNSTMQGCHTVLHLAVSNLRKSLSDPRHSHEVNATGTLNLLETAKKLNMARFVYVSSSEVYGTAQTVPMSESHPTAPCTVYAASKLAGEHYTLTFAKINKINATVVRPFNNYGPRSHFERENGEIIPRTTVRLLNGLPPLLFGNGQQTRDFQYVTDTSRGLITVMENQDCAYEVFNLAYGKECKMVDLCHKLSEKLKLKIDPKYVGQDRPGDVLRHYADSSKFQKRFGFKPEVSLDEGLDLYIKWFLENYNNPKALLAEMQEVNW